MELPICMLLGLGFTHIANRNRPSSYVVMSVLLLLVAVGLTQMKERRKIDHNKVDIVERVEYRAAEWATKNLQWRDGRVFTSGSTTFWFNSFTRQWQIGGCCDQGISNDATLRLSYLVNYSKSDQDILTSISWARALGVQALLLPNAASNDAYKDTQIPAKYEPYLQRLTGPTGLDIFRVPQSRRSLVQIIKREILVPLSPFRESPEFTQSVAAFADALKNTTNIKDEWLDEQTVSIKGSLLAGDVIVVQTNYSAGWTLSGNPNARLYPDGLGLTVIDPECKVDCTLDLRLEWKGQQSTTVGRIIGVISLSCLASIVGWRRYQRKE